MTTSELSNEVAIGTSTCVQGSIITIRNVHVQVRTILIALQPLQIGLVSKAKKTKKKETCVLMGHLENI